MAKKITLTPSEKQTDIINFFSDKLGQKLINTKVVDNGDGTKSVELELAGKIVTIVMDQSGSMTWNDNNNFRNEIATDLVNKIDINYPGDIFYNLIEYGADIIDVLFFGIEERDGFDPNDVDSLASMVTADDEANYDGMRVVRNVDHYPTTILDGDIVFDGFSSRIKDDGLTEGVTYYYTVYTYNKDFKFSEGVRIKVTPQDRIIPRATSIFKTVVDSEDLTRGIPFKGNNVQRDDNTLGIWHMDEGEGINIYDFSDTSAILEYNKEDPTWYEDRFVPAGASGLFFDGENNYASISGESDLWRDIEGTQPELTIMAWVFLYKDSGNQVVVYSGQGQKAKYQLVFEEKKLSFYDGIKKYTTSSDILSLNKWQHICVNRSSSGEVIFYHNGEIEGNASIAAAPAGSGSTYHFTIGASVKE